MCNANIWFVFKNICITFIFSGFGVVVDFLDWISSVVLGWLVFVGCVISGFEVLVFLVISNW